MNWKKVLIGCSVVSGVLLLVAMVAGFFLVRHLIKSGPHRLTMPSYLENPSVLAGSGFLLRSQFFQDTRLGKITDIVLGDLDPGQGLEIGIAGREGAAFLDEDRTVKSSVSFNKRADHVDIIDVDGDGICEFLNRGSWAINSSLIDHNGNTLWTYGGLSGVDDMAAGDIDRDGKTEFVVGFNGGGGVHLLDENGKKKWRKRDGNVWHVEMVDTDGDGTLEIVHSNAGGTMTVRDRKGDVIRRERLGPYFSEFSLCSWPTKSDRIYALLAEDDTIWLFDFDGTTAAQFNAPRCGKLGDGRGTPVKLRDDQPEYLAVIVDFQNWNRAVLYVYDSTKTLVFQEIMPESCASIAAMPLADSETETLLIGGEGKVWKYQIGDTAESSGPLAANALGE